MGQPEGNAVDPQPGGDAGAAVRLLRSFLIAPIPAALLAVLLAIALGNARASHQIVAFFLFVMILLYLVELIFGVAIRLILQRRGRKSLGVYAVGGLAMVSMPNVPYTIFGLSRGHPATEAAAYFALVALYGTLTGMTFWLSARPNKALASWR